MVKRPEWITVGDAPYLVTELFADDPLDGEYSASKQTIGVKCRLPRQYERYILVHELVHAIFEHAGAVGEEGEKYTEEQVACIVGRALPALLVQNPDLVAYLVS